MGCQHTPCWCHCWFIYRGSTGRQVWQDKDFSIRCYSTYHWSSSFVCIISLTISWSTGIVLLKTNASNVFSSTAQTIQTMIIGRLLAGIGIGISSAIVPLYISEVIFSDLCSASSFLETLLTFFLSVRSRQPKSVVHLDL